MSFKIDTALCQFHDRNKPRGHTAVAKNKWFLRVGRATKGRKHCHGDGNAMIVSAGEGTRDEFREFISLER